MAIVNKFNVNNKQVTLDADIIENMSANDVSYNSSLQYDENTVGKKLSELESQVIYDVTANNDSVTFDSLSELLSSENLSTLIPVSVRCGGMSIRFIKSSDNKYVQYRLMNQNWSVVETDWHGVDDEPTAGSDNLVKSGGVYDKFIQTEQGFEYYKQSVENYIKTEEVQIEPHVMQNTYVSSMYDGKIVAYYGSQLRTFHLNGGNTYKINISGQPNDSLAVGYCYDTPEVGVEVSNVTIPKVDDLNGTIITPDDDCFLLIGNSDKITISSCSLIVSPNGSALSSIQANQRLDHLNTENILHLYDNEDEMLLPYSVFSEGGSNQNKLGYYYESAIGKPVVGIKLKSFSDGTLKYGTALITNNIVGDFIEKGSITVVSGINTYLFNKSITLNENELIYIQGVYLYGARKANNNSSFIDNHNNNSIIGTNFSFSYCLVFGSQLNSIVDELWSPASNKITYYALGDSITWGAYGDGWTPQNLKGMSYADYLAEMIGAKKFVNRGVSGASVYNNFNSQVNLVYNDATLITVCMGLNDITLALKDENPVSVGDYVQIIKMQKVENYTNIDDYGDNILGRYRWCMERLMVEHPNAKIIAITMPSTNHSNTSYINKWNLIKYGICGICNFLGIPFIDYIKLSDIFVAHYDSTQPNWNDFLHDGTHPEKEGYHMMATAIYSLLNGLL